MELTKPLSWTVPLKVSTLISADFKVGSLNMAALILVVMTVSSTYSPVPSWVEVDAHPRTEASAMMKKKEVNRLMMSSMIVLLVIRVKIGSIKMACHVRYDNPDMTTPIQQPRCDNFGTTTSIRQLFECLRHNSCMPRAADQLKDGPCSSCGRAV